MYHLFPMKHIAINTNGFLRYSFTHCVAAALLQVEYKERLSSAGKLPYRWDRREGGVNAEREVLAARAVDRALRPLCPPGFLYGMQVGQEVG